MRISIRHQLSISPPPGAANLVLQLLLMPQSGATQKVESWDVAAPGMENAAQFDDAYGNRLCLANLARPEGELTIDVRGLVETRDTHGVLGKPRGEPVPALFKRVTPLTKAPVTLYSKFRGAKESRLDVLHALMLRVSETLAPLAERAQAADMAQSQSQTQASQSQSQSQSQGEPVMAAADEGIPPEPAGHEVVARLPRPPARNYAHMFVGGARALDIPARYVTGYLMGEGGEPGAFHAWAEAYDDKLGWIGFDAMLELCPTDRHVRLAAGLDALSAAPLRCVPAGDGVLDKGVIMELAHAD